MQAWCRHRPRGNAPQDEPVQRFLAITLHSFEADAARRGVDAHDAVALNRLLLRLGRWVMRYSPLVGIEPSPGPAALVVDITGCLRLHGSDEHLLGRVAREMRAIGFAAGAATAGTAAAALAAPARRAIPSGDELDALADEPMRALRLDETTLRALAEVNLRFIGELAPLARTDLAQRFGAGLLARMDMVSGRLIQPLATVAFEAPLAVELPFEGPTTHLESVEAALAAAVEDLCRQLQASQRGVRELEVIFLRAGAPPECIRIHLGAPSSRSNHLLTLLRPRVERLQMAFGIEGIRLCALRSSRRSHVQASCAFGPAPDGAPRDTSAAQHLTDECLDVIAARISRARIWRAEAIERFEPELAFRMVAWGHRRRAGSAVPLMALRPTVLLETPRQVGVRTDSAGTPQDICASGPWTRVRVACGPERLHDGWWGNAAGRTRDYWRIAADDGRWLWVYAREGNWFLHGVWA